MNWRKPIIFFLLYISGSKIPRNLKIIEKVSRLSKKELKNYQDRKLSKILIHAYENVPYYSRVLKKCRVVVGGKVNLKNFNKIPILTKDIIRREGNNLYSKDYKKRRFYKNTSGGSTGEPVKFIQDRNYKEMNVIANKLYFNSMLGKEPGEREINLWGSERDIDSNSQGIKNNIINYLYNRNFLNAFKLSDSKIDKFIDIVNNFKPKTIWSYVESLDEFSKYINKNKLKVYSPEFIITTAGTLYPEIRKRAEKAFSCPVYNQYGSREVGPVAIECKEKNGLHYFPWSHYIEIINGEIIITCLTNYSMPLIRYEIGDTASESLLAKCRCGLNTLYFDSIEGRTISHFVTNDNEIVYGQYFIHLFYYRKWVKKFQIVQNKVNEIECKIVGRKNQKEMGSISFDIKKVMGNDCKVVFKFQKHIKNSKSGKYLYTICNLKNHGKKSN